MVDFVAEGAALLPELVELRRELHQIPELGLDNPQTQQRVLKELEGLGLEITLGKETTSIVAVLRGGKPGKTVLLRGDMDGLPVEENTGLDYASTNGRMHACGHDLHTSGLVGAAKLLAAHRDELQGNVIFMFQPGEEGAGGAEVMIKEGVLDAAGERPIGAYGIHVVPGPFGTFAARPGAIMAGADMIEITVRGRGGHGSSPWMSVDPVPVAAEIVTALQTMVTRQFNVFDPVVLTVTQLEASKAFNVIPDTAVLRATLRTLSRESVAAMQEKTKRLAEGIAEAHGATAEVNYVVQFPPTLNDETETERVFDTLGSLFGEERAMRMPVPFMGSEDFSFVLQEVPGAFFLLQCSPRDADLTKVAYNHSAEVVFDDGVLGDQAAALAALAWNRLENA